MTSLAGDMTLEDVAPDGRTVLTIDDQRLGIIARGPGETTERDRSWLDFSALCDLSRDGRQILFDETGDGGGASYSVYIRTTDGGLPVRLGDGGSFCFLGSDRVLAIDLHGQAERHKILPTGAGEPELLPPDGLVHGWANCLPDGRRFVMSAYAPSHGSRLYLQDAAGGPPRPFTAEGVSLIPYVNLVSPDGTRVVARGPDGALALYQLSDGSTTPLGGLTPDMIPTGWTPDGRLDVYSAGELPAVVFALDLTTGRTQPVVALAPPDPTGIQFIRPPLIRLDGRSYAYSYLSEVSILYLVTGLQ